MSDVTVMGPPPAAPPGRVRMSPGDRVRFVLRGIGQVLITAGLVVLLFVVYEVWITNIFADREQRHVASEFRKELADGKDPLLPLPGSSTPAAALGTGIANLYIPRFGSAFHFTVVQGGDVPTDSQLEKGPAHYLHTASPGQVGNFALAGHRVGKGEPFLNLDKLRPGDAVIIETKSDWYVYRVKGTENGLSRDDSDGVPGRVIVAPGDGDVLSPVPNHPGSTPTERLMTMTTCHPKFTAQRRMVVFAKLDHSVRAVAKSGAAVLRMPASIKSLYAEVSG